MPRTAITQRRSSLTEILRWYGCAKEFVGRIRDADNPAPRSPPRVSRANSLSCASAKEVFGPTSGCWNQECVEPRPRRYADSPEIGAICRPDRERRGTAAAG